MQRLSDPAVESRVDSILSQMTLAEKAAQILREEMEGCVHYAVPLSTDVHTGKNWLEAH